MLPNSKGLLAWQRSIASNLEPQVSVVNLDPPRLMSLPKFLVR